jgi:hypothetical protein
MKKEKKLPEVVETTTVANAVSYLKSAISGGSEITGSLAINEVEPTESEVQAVAYLKQAFKPEPICYSNRPNENGVCRNCQKIHTTK